MSSSEYLDQLKRFHRLGRGVDTAVGGLSGCVGGSLSAMTDVLPPTVAVPLRRERVNGVAQDGVFMSTCGWTKGRLMPTASQTATPPAQLTEDACIPPIENKGVVWDPTPSPSPSDPDKEGGCIDSALQSILRPVEALGMVGAAHLAVAPSIVPTSCLPTSPLQVYRVWYAATQLLTAQCCGEWKVLSLRASEGGGAYTTLERQRSRRGGSFFGSSLPTSAVRRRAEGSAPIVSPSVGITTALYEYVQAAILSSPNAALLTSILPYFIQLSEAGDSKKAASDASQLDTIRAALGCVLSTPTSEGPPRIVAASLTHMLYQVLPPIPTVVAALSKAPYLPMDNTTVCDFPSQFEGFLLTLVSTALKLSETIPSKTSTAPSSANSTPPGTPTPFSGFGGPGAPSGAPSMLPREVVIDMASVVRVVQYALLVRVKLLVADYWLVCMGATFQTVKDSAIRTLESVYPLFTSASTTAESRPSGSATSLYRDPIAYSVVLSRCWLHMGFLGGAAAARECLHTVLAESDDCLATCPTQHAQLLLHRLLPSSAPEVYTGDESIAPMGAINHSLKRIETLCLATVAALAEADADAAETFSSEALQLSRKAQGNPNGAVSSRAERVLPVVLLLRSEAMQLCPNGIAATSTNTATTASPFDVLGKAQTATSTVAKEDWLGLLKQAAVYDQGITRFAGLSLQSCTMEATQSPRHGTHSILSRMWSGLRVDMDSTVNCDDTQGGSVPMPAFVHQLLGGYLPTLGSPSSASLLLPSQQDSYSSFGADILHQYEMGSGYPKGASIDGGEKGALLRDIMSFEADVKRSLTEGKRYILSTTATIRPKDGPQGEPCGLCVVFPCTVLLALLRPFVKELKRLSLLEVPGNTQRVRRTAPLSLAFPPLALLCKDLWNINMQGANPMLCSPTQVVDGVGAWGVPFLTFFAIEARWAMWWGLHQAVDATGALKRVVDDSLDIHKLIQGQEVDALVALAVSNDQPQTIRIQAADAAGLLTRRGVVPKDVLPTAPADTVSTPVPEVALMSTEFDEPSSAVSNMARRLSTAGCVPANAVRPVFAPPSTIAGKGLPPTTPTTDASILQRPPPPQPAAHSRSTSTIMEEASLPQVVKQPTLNTSLDNSRCRTPLRKACAFGGTFVVPDANSRRQTPLREPTPKRDPRPNEQHPIQ